MGKKSGLKNKFQESQFFLLLREIRPRQGVKNLAVFAAAIFNRALTRPDIFWNGGRLFLIFCLLSTSAYLINDLADLKNDRAHPFKKNRPLASGKLKLKTAFIYLLIALAAAGGLIGQEKPVVGLTAAAFFILQMGYTFWLKKIPILDILTIAGAYILRVRAGELALGQSLSVWLTLAVIFLALFLATGKRRAELAMLASQKEKVKGVTRSALSHYSEPLVNTYLSLFASCALLAYGYFTFNQNPAGNKFVLTTPFVLYGIMRYLQLIYKDGQGESPERLLFIDKSLLATVLGWGLTVMASLYLI